jgi:hypothetical protein
MSHMFGSVVADDITIDNDVRLQIGMILADFFADLAADKLERDQS